MFAKKNLFNLCKFLLLSLIFSVVLSACQTKEKVQLTDNQGKQYLLPGIKQKYVVINFFAPWCKPCYEEIPSLNAFAKKYSNDVLVLGVDFDESKAQDLQDKITSMGIAFPVLANNPSAVLGISDIRGLPATFVLNQSGKVIKVLYGEQTVKSLAAATVSS